MSDLAKNGVDHWVAAANEYAKSGQLLKAIAACKAVLHLDPTHTATQQMLVDLYAKKEIEHPPLTPLAPEPERDPAFHDAPTLPRGAPLEAVSLHAVLGGRRTPPMVPKLDAASEIYEISVDELEMIGTDPGATPLFDDWQPIPLSVEPSINRLDPKKVEQMVARAEEELAKSSAMPKIPLFSMLNPARLLKLIQRVEVREVPPGQAIIREEERSDSLYVIVKGEVRVIVEKPHPRSIATLTDGAFFGELGLLTNFARSATVMAEKPTTIIQISREVISDVIADSPDLLKMLVRFFRDRLLARLTATSKLFVGLSPEDLAGVTKRFKFLEVPPDTTLIEAGARVTGLFFLLCGEAAVKQDGARVASLAPGDIFGEMSLLAAGTASASVVSTTKCWTMHLPREEFHETIVTYPQILEYVSELADQRRAKNEQLKVDFH